MNINTIVCVFTSHKPCWNKHLQPFPWRFWCGAGEGEGVPAIPSTQQDYPLFTPSHQPGIPHNFSNQAENSQRKKPLIINVAAQTYRLLCTLLNVNLILTKKKAFRRDLSLALLLPSCTYNHKTTNNGFSPPPPPTQWHIQWKTGTLFQLLRLRTREVLFIQANSLLN